ncbi:pyridoxamine 5'-phosphate oxidase family protein [Paenibacillus cisolokensis]|uniref:pyridoxamine 5'-phosphate oxidase family protein n=1 Tax=Paenibacillus cisolokensis TaxID=1658519 RepID=UPI003D29B301
MSENKELPQGLCEWLNGRDLESKSDTAMVLLTVTEDGWPHTAMISAGEVIALDRSRLRLALWPGTVTAGNMKRTGQATLVTVHDGAVHSIRLRVKALPDVEGARHPRQRFAADVVHVREDRAKYAEVLSGVTFRLHDPAEVLKRWSETIAELREEEAR